MFREIFSLHPSVGWNLDKLPTHDWLNFHVPIRSGFICSKPWVSQIAGVGHFRNPRVRFFLGGNLPAEFWENQNGKLGTERLFSHIQKHTPTYTLEFPFCSLYQTLVLQIVPLIHKNVEALWFSNFFPELLTKKWALCRHDTPNVSKEVVSIDYAQRFISPTTSFCWDSLQTKLGGLLGGLVG